MVARRIRVGPPGSTASADFIARTVDNTWDAQYTTLIDGLVSDGVWSKLDALWIMCTSTEANAILNLVSTSFTLVNTNGETFTAASGGVGGFKNVSAPTAYLDTQFNPTTGGTQKYSQNSAHISVWANNNVQANSPLMANSTSGTGSVIYPNYDTGSGHISIYQINDATPTSSSFPTSPGGSPIGFFVASRTGASGGGSQEGYHNGSAQSVTPASSSAAVANDTFVLLADKFGGSITNQYGGIEISAASIGSGLSAGDVTNLYTRIGTFRTAVGL